MTQPGRRRSRIIAGVAAVSIGALALAGCSGGGSDDTGDGQTITMWTFKQPHVAALEEAAAAFQEQTGITVEIQAVTPEDAFQTRVQASAQTGDLPDVLEMHSDGEDRVFGGSGVLQDITPILPSDIDDRFIPSIAGSGIITAQQVENSTAPGATDAGIVEGARYAVPFTIGTFGIFYANKEKLAAAGYDAAPETWEEFIDAATKTVAADSANGGVSLGFQAISVGINWVLNPLAFAELGLDGYNGLWADDTGTDWGSQNGKDALSLYSELDGLWMPGTQTVTIDDADLSFVQGKSAFAIGGTFTLAFLAQNGMDLDDVIAFPIPEPENGAVDDLKLSPIALTSLGITKDADDVDAASQWIDFLSTPEVAATFAVTATDLPAVNLGDDAASVLGENLSTLTAVFDGTPEQSYNVGNNPLVQPPGFDLDEAGAIVARLSPLQELSVDQSGADLSTLLQNYWTAAG